MLVSLAHHNNCSIFRGVSFSFLDVGTFAQSTQMCFRHFSAASKKMVGVFGSFSLGFGVQPLCEPDFTPEFGGGLLPECRGQQKGRKPRTSFSPSFDLEAERGEH